MSVQHSPKRFKDRNRDVEGIKSSTVQLSATHSSTPRDQHPQAALTHDKVGDKTLPVEDPGDGEVRQRSVVAEGSQSGGLPVGKLDQDMYRPFGTCSRSSSDTSSEIAYCKGGPSNLVCNKEVKDGEMGVQCNTCQCWFHSKCQSIPKAAYNALVKHEALSWHCVGCKPGLGQKVRSDTDAGCQCSSLEAKIDKLEELLRNNLDKGVEASKQTCDALKRDNIMLRESMEARMEKVEKVMRAHATLIGNQETMLQNSLKKMQDDKSSYAETVKGSCVAMEKVVKKIESIPVQEKKQGGLQTEKAIAGVFDDFLDKERRKLNVVMHNIPESQGESYAERMEQDKAKFKNVIRDGMRLNVNVTKAFRVGKPTQEKPRLLVVGLENAEVKIEILKMAPQLRSTEEWSDVYITPDLTWKEREEGRKLREELRRRTKAGEDNLIIRRGRIVQRGNEDKDRQPSHLQQERGTAQQPIPRPQLPRDHARDQGQENSQRNGSMAEGREPY